jgi:bacillithiol system protein YtxJ
MNWIPLTDSSQLPEIIAQSNSRIQVIFKHSTRCSISSMAKNRLERSIAPELIDFYYLDLIAYRQLSDKIAEDFKVAHESPQVLMIKNGDCSYNESHSGIGMEAIMDQAIAIP